MTDPVALYLTKFPAPTRAETVDQALRSLRDRASRMVVVMCELAWEAHDGGYWSKVLRPDGTAYPSEEAYFEEVLHVPAWRSAAKRIAVGRALAAALPSERDELRRRVERIGLAKATVLAPVIQDAVSKAGDPRDLLVWFDRAREWSVDVLQRTVSGALGARARGLTPAGQRFRSYLEHQMPDLEAKAVLQRFFEIGAVVAATDNPLGILLDGLREALSSWEPQVGARERARGEEARSDGDGDSLAAEAGDGGALPPAAERGGGGDGGGAAADGAGDPPAPRRRRRSRAARGGVTKRGA